MHAFIGYDKKKEIVVAHTLPYTAAWGAGQGSRGSQNYNPQAHIQFEICEDGLKDINYYKKVFGAAEEYCVIYVNFLIFQRLQSSGITKPIAKESPIIMETLAIG